MTLAFKDCPCSDLPAACISLRSKQEDEGKELTVSDHVEITLFYNLGFLNLCLG